MPYITQDRRDGLDDEIETLQGSLEVMGSEAGDLNYVLSRLVARQFWKKPKYVKICMGIGTLVCVALEFYRRAAGAYEDKAIKKNGDIEEYMSKKPSICGYSECVRCNDAPVEFEPEEGDADFDQCDCGRELLGVHSTDLHKVGDPYDSLQPRSKRFGLDRTGGRGPYPDADNRGIKADKTIEAPDLVCVLNGGTYDCGGS